MKPTKYQLESVHKVEEAKDLAHTMCIDKIKQLSEDLKAANRRNEELKQALKDWQIHLECKS